MPVYMIRAGSNGPVKFGFAVDPLKRCADLQTAHYEVLSIIRVWQGGRVEESALHLRFERHHTRGEWYAFDDAMMGDVGLVEMALPIRLGRNAIPSNPESAEALARYRAGLAEWWAVLDKNPDAIWRSDDWQPPVPSSPAERDEALAQYRASIRLPIPPAGA